VSRVRKRKIDGCMYSCYASSEQTDCNRFEVSGRVVFSLISRWHRYTIGHKVRQEEKEEKEEVAFKRPLVVLSLSLNSLSQLSRTQKKKKERSSKLGCVVDLPSISSGHRLLPKNPDLLLMDDPKISLSRERNKVKRLKNKHPNETKKKRNTTTIHFLPLPPPLKELRERKREIKRKRDYETPRIRRHLNRPLSFFPKPKKRKCGSAFKPTKEIEN